MSRWGTADELRAQLREEMGRIADDPAAASPRALAGRPVPDHRRGRRGFWSFLTQ
jgi:hypothetical protein